jgi:hypothetical protein
MIWEILLQPQKEWEVIQSCSANFFFGLRPKPKLISGFRSPFVLFFSKISQAFPYFFEVCLKRAF